MRLIQLVVLDDPLQDSSPPCARFQAGVLETRSRLAQLGCMPGGRLAVTCVTVRHRGNAHSERESGLSDKGGLRIEALSGVLSMSGRSGRSTHT